MTCLLCWDLDCVTDGIVNIWAADKPNEVCPIDGGHTVNSVVPTVGDDYNTGQPLACGERFMHDGNGRVYKMTIDQNGAWVATQVDGPAPS